MTTPPVPSISTTLRPVLARGLERLLDLAMLAEVDMHLERWAELRSRTGRAVVVRNGAGTRRIIESPYGELRVIVPRVRSDPLRSETAWTSRLLPRYRRHLYLRSSMFEYFWFRGLCSGDPTLAIAAVAESPAIDHAVTLGAHLRPLFAAEAASMLQDRFDGEPFDGFAFHAMLDKVGRKAMPLTLRSETPA